MRFGRTVSVLVVAGLAGGGYAAWASASEAAAGYRTATVSRGDVSEVLTLSGTLAAAGTDELSFGADGVVSSVLVDAGAQVEAGDVLARLDPTSLKAAAQRARADLAAARAQLESDEDAQADAVEQSASAEQSSDGTSETPAGSDFVAATPAEEPAPDPEPETDPAPQQALQQLSVQQDAVTTAQTTSSEALAAASTALAHQQDVCATAFADAPDPDADPDGNQACSDALDQVEAAQQTTAEAQSALQQAITALATTLTDAISALSEESPQSGQPAEHETEQPSQEQPTQQPTERPDQSSGRPDAETGGPTVTAATLAKDQAVIEQAKADLVDAELSLGGATVRATHAGRVLQVPVARGDSASAGDTAVVVASSTATTLAVLATDTQVARLEVGQEATVTPAGASAPHAAKVTYLDPVPDTSTGSTTYAVTITLDQARLDLPAGSPASADVVIGTATDVLTVPTSAVTSGSVLVVDGDTATRTAVMTGIVGPSRTEIADGLEVGDEVAVADLDAELPSSDSSDNETGGFQELGGGGPGGGSGPVRVTRGGPGGP